MATLNTGDLEIPAEILDPWVKKINDASVVASLSGQIPMKFGTGQSITFSTNEAEHVGEGQAKSGSTYTSTSFQTSPQKFQKTVRFSDEVMWADEDHQLQVVRQILEQIQPALSRALDYGVIHGIDPLSGTSVAAMAAHLESATVVPASVDVDLDSTDGPFTFLDAVDALVLANRYVPGDVALDPALAAKFSAYRNPTTQQKLYPNFRLSSEVSELEGHRAAVSRTVRADQVGTAPYTSDLLGLVGDMSTVRWGIQRSIGLKVIEYGDPDGAGRDLQRFNEVAFRAEVVYGWGIADGAALVRLVDATESGE